jgi:hypothetical protein
MIEVHSESSGQLAMTLTVRSTYGTDSLRMSAIGPKAKSGDVR